MSSITRANVKKTDYDNNAYLDLPPIFPRKYRAQDGEIVRTYEHNNETWYTIQLDTDLNPSDVKSGYYEKPEK